MNKWAEIKEGEVGLFVPKGTFFMLGEATLAKIDRIDGTNVYMMNGDVLFQSSQLKIVGGE